ncbi:hypothetical protein JCM5350_004351 [Sporobolomyces pararoseus]
MASLSTVALAAGGIAYVNARLGNDLKMASGLINARIGLASANRRDENSIYYYFDRAVKARKDQDCYVCQDQVLSFEKVSIEVNKMAHWLLSQGLGKGDSFALYMPNKPAYPIIWLACLAINVECRVPAFINFNLTGEDLIHCIQVASPKLVLYESDLTSSISDISDQLRQKNPSIKFVRWIDRFTKEVGMIEKKAIEDEIRLDENVLGGMSKERIDDKYRKGITWQDPAVYIFTSLSPLSPLLSSSDAHTIAPGPPWDLGPPQGRYSYARKNCNSDASLDQTQRI